MVAKLSLKAVRGQSRVDDGPMSSRAIPEASEVPSWCEKLVTRCSARWPLCGRPRSLASQSVIPRVVPGGVSSWVGED